jgi:hypothetical protein
VDRLAAPTSRTNTFPYHEMAILKLEDGPWGKFALAQAPHYSLSMFTA